ncbi:hypothetical protein MHYP_G00194160 [Metynnis hypsauchen]
MQEVLPQENSCFWPEGSTEQHPYRCSYGVATRKKTATAATGGGPPVAAFTPAEELALEQNSRRPIIVGIEGGITSDPVCPHDTQPYVKGNGRTKRRPSGIHVQSSKLCKRRSE